MAASLDAGAKAVLSVGPALLALPIVQDHAQLASMILDGCRSFGRSPVGSGGACSAGPARSSRLTSGAVVGFLTRLLQFLIGVQMPGDVQLLKRLLQS